MDEGSFRGGKQRHRDRWYGMKDRPDFKAFERWWHRKGKRLNGGRDVNGREEAEDFWGQWVSEGKPHMKVGDFS